MDTVYMRSASLYDIIEATRCLQSQLNMNSIGIKNPALIKHYSKMLKRVGLTTAESLKALDGEINVDVEITESKLEPMDIKVSKRDKTYIKAQTELIYKTLSVDIQPNTAEHLLTALVETVNNSIVGSKMKADDKKKFKAHFYELKINYIFV